MSSSNIPFDKQTTTTNNKLVEFRFDTRILAALAGDAFQGDRNPEVSETQNRTDDVVCDLVNTDTNLTDWRGTLYQQRLELAQFPAAGVDLQNVSGSFPRYAPANKIF